MAKVENKVCKKCGYCEECGRRSPNGYYQPIYPYVPWYPYQYYPNWYSTVTVGSQSQSQAGHSSQYAVNSIN